ncbi:hypothetical protein VTK26DRAFT_5591 [Humicola hyalothermophila]
MGYKWEPHRQTCYRLYVEERKSLDEIVEYMRVHHGFTPSRRSFQTAFSRWGFPNKLNPAYKNERLVARVRELWEQNLRQKDMVQALRDEGFEVGEREVERIRQRLGLHLRKVGGFARQLSSSAAQRDRTQGTDRDRGAGEDAENDERGDGGDGTQAQVRDDHQDLQNSFGTAGLSPVEAQVQQEALAMRMAQKEHRKRLLAIENQEKWLSKKRRRHTKPYAGLPADPPAPPRFPSETTLTEAKQILQLDKVAYQTVRKKFYDICVNANVYKKTLVGPERWEALKNQLVRESMHLRAVMWDPADMEQKKLAIEIIACDVTKRIRVETNGLSLAEAKLILGLNPDQGREVRAHLYRILAEEGFTSKYEDGPEFFEALKQRWIAESPILSAIVASGDADPDYQSKMRAVKHLCRDATRRYRDDLVRLKKDPLTLLRQSYSKPATPKPKATKSPSQQAHTAQAKKQAPKPTQAPAQTAATASESPSQPRRRGRPPGSRNKKSLPHTEPGLVLADAPDEPPEDQGIMDAQLGDSVLPSSETQSPFVDDGHQYAGDPREPLAQAQQMYQPPSAPSSSPGPIAVFFRLHPASQAMLPAGTPSQWIFPLSSRTMTDLRSAAVAKCPPGAVCLSVEGIIKDGKGGELPLPVSDEAELETYLEHVQGHGAPVFSVHVVLARDSG